MNLDNRVIYIGVDPGKDGYITVYKNGRFLFFPMPEHKVETGKFLKNGKPQMKTVFHEAGLVTLKNDLHNICNGYIVKACLEEVGGRGGWSATNNFNFGHTAGLQKFILMTLAPNILMVRPQKWQSAVRQGYPDIKKSSSTGKTMISDPKAVAKVIVDAEYPNIDFRKTEKSKVDHDGKIDSFLICLYLMRQDG
tara:strand:+ start:63 stop:644 length:582 start_codon:yes stop_codon:yes gene_type:complete